ncbi:MAG: AEC family transporter, partial [Clostridiales bacterium]|nr:AEC family transporter [Clostridiales bacterium]
MQNILVRAFSLMLVIVLGFIIKKIGWVRKEDVGIFSNLVVKVTLPCAIVTSFNQVNI